MGAVTPVRPAAVRAWLGVCTLLVVVSISYVDRVNTSVLVTDPGFLQHFGLVGDRAGQGALMSFFLVGYGVAALLLTPVFEARLGVRGGLLLSVGVWAAVTLAAPFALGLPLLLLARAVLGAAEGPLFSLKTMFVRSEFPPGSWGKPNAVSSMGVSVGTAAGIPIAVYLVTTFDWHSSFIALAVLNAVVGIPLVWLFVRPAVQRVDAVRPAGLRATLDTLRAAAATPGLVSVLVIEIATLAFLWGTATWLPSYLREARGFSIAQMGVLAAMPFVVSLVSGFLGGWVIDRLRPALLPVVLVVGSIGAGACLAVVVNTGDRLVAAGFLIAANAFWGVQGPVIPTMVQRAARPAAVGSTYGLVNGVGNLVSAAMPWAMGLAIAASGGRSYDAGLGLLILTQATTLTVAVVLLLRMAQRARTDGVPTVGADLYSGGATRPTGG